MANELEKKTPQAIMTSFGDLEGVTERPESLDPTDKTGTETIGAKDLRIPRLVIAQGLTPQLAEGKIPGLKMFDLFNDVTDEIYASKDVPLRFIPLSRNVVCLEFDSKDRTKVVDRNVPQDDPRLSWNGDEPPRATKFTEFVALLIHKSPRKPEPIIISIKETNKWQRRAAERLTGFVKFQEGPIYAGFKTVSSHMEKNDAGTFGVFVFNNAGFIPKDTPGGAALFEYARQFAEDLKGKKIEVQREAGDDSFNVHEFEKQGSEM